MQLVPFINMAQGGAAAIWAFYGDDAPSGGAVPWFDAPRGSLYFRMLAGSVTVWQKIAQNGDSDDWVTAATSTSGIIDHGALSGLTDDDHAQYLLATGTRSGASSQAQELTKGLSIDVSRAAANGTYLLSVANLAALYIYKDVSGYYTVGFGNGDFGNGTYISAIDGNGAITLSSTIGDILLVTAKTGGEITLNADDIKLTGGSVDLDSNKIINLANAAADTDALNQQTGDARYAPIAGAHAAVTLDTNADTVLSLSTQALGLDTQVKNKVLAGPATGADAVPTFRVLASDDIPSLDHGAKLTGLTDDDHTIYLLATGTRAGATTQAQTFTNGLTTPSGASTGGMKWLYLAAAGASKSWKAQNDHTEYGDFVLLSQTAQGDTFDLVRIYCSATGAWGIGTTSPTLGDGTYASSLTLQTASSNGGFLAMRKPDTTNFLQGIYLQDKASNAGWFYGVEPTGNTVFGHGSGITETAAITAAYLSYMLAITSAGFVGIGTNAPNAKLDVRGGICLPTKPITVSDTPYTVLATDYTIRCNCVGGAITVALPEATGTGRILNIKKTDSSANAVTVDGYSTNTIDGETTQSISSQYDNMQIQDAAAGAWDIL